MDNDVITGTQKVYWSSSAFYKQDSTEVAKQNKIFIKDLKKKSIKRLFPVQRP